MKSESLTIRTLRAMAWSRAKGELQAVLNTFWQEVDGDDSAFTKMESATEEFIKTVEDNGYAE